MIKIVGIEFIPRLGNGRPENGIGTFVAPSRRQPANYLLTKRRERKRLTPNKVATASRSRQNVEPESGTAAARGLSRTESEKITDATSSTAARGMSQNCSRRQSSTQLRWLISARENSMGMSARIIQSGRHEIRAGKNKTAGKFSKPRRVCPVYCDEHARDSALQRTHGIRLRSNMHTRNAQVLRCCNLRKNCGGWKL